MKHLPADGLHLVPWKNGGGVTREIAVYPRSGTGYDFLWRVSMATVSKSGPFSGFDGIDRTIAMMQGDGIVLKGDAGNVALTRESAPYSFSGETRIDAAVIGGETTDLNAMTRRGRFRHSVERLQFNETTAVRGESDETIVVFNSPVTVTTPEGRLFARRFDAITGIEKHDRLHLHSEGDGEVFIIRIAEIFEA